VSQNNGTSTTKSAAEKRGEKLIAELGIETYVRYPRELLEYWMDRPPEDEKSRQEWQPIHRMEQRVYATRLRYSWCWPVNMKYSVVTDERDEILRDRDGSGKPVVLTQERIAKMLGTSQQRVSEADALLVAKKALRFEGNRGYPVPKPILNDQERNEFYRSTPVKSEVPGPSLPPAVFRRLTYLLKELGIEDYRSTPVMQQAIQVRTRFLEAFKKARYAEREGYNDLITTVRNLYSQSHSPDSSSSSAAAASEFGSRSAAAASPPTPPKEERAENPHTPEPGKAGTATARAVDPEVEQVRQSMEYYVRPVDLEAAARLVTECRKADPEATVEQIRAVIHAKGPRARRMDSPIGFLLRTVPPCFVAGAMRSRPPGSPGEPGESPPPGSFDAGGESYGQFKQRWKLEHSGDPPTWEEWANGRRA
jgi:hypothetical protein